MIIGFMIFIYLKNPDRNYLYYEGSNIVDVVVSKKDIEPGEVLDKGDIELVKVKDEVILGNASNYTSSIEDIVGKKALYPIKRGQILPSSYFLSKEKWYEGKHEYAIEVDIPTTVANSINVGDYIDINVSYEGTSIENIYSSKDYTNFDIVVSKILVEDIRNVDGISKDEFNSQSPDGVFVPRYIIVNIDYKQLDDYLGSAKEGIIFVVKYDDVNAPANLVTYNKRNIFNSIDESTINTNDDEN